MKLREEEVMKLKKNKTSRYERSAIPYTARSAVHMYRPEKLNVVQNF